MDTDIEFIDNGVSKTIVSFTGLSHGNGVHGFKKEFIGLLKQFDFNVMFVADRELSWYNTIDIDKIKSKLNNQEVITIGNSMGGYNAIQFANDFNVTKAIAFATQYSIHQDIVPDEERWVDYAAKIKQWSHKHLMFNDTTEYFIFGGDEFGETYHMNMISQQKNIHKFIITAGHNVASVLKTKGILYPIIMDSITKTPQIVAEKYALNADAAPGAPIRIDEFIGMKMFGYDFN